MFSAVASEPPGEPRDINTIAEQMERDGIVECSACYAKHKVPFCLRAHPWLTT